VVVPIREEAFAAARKLHVYAVPISRSTSDVKFVAFYRGAPISAITHYAEVEAIEKNLAFSDVFPSGSAVLTREDQPLKVYRLGPLHEFKRRVKKGKNPPISGPRYTKLPILQKARFLDEVWAPEEDVNAKDRPKAKGRAKPAAKGAPKGPSEKEDGRKRRGRKGRTKDAGTARDAQSTDAPAKVSGQVDEKEPKKKRKRGSRGRKGGKAKVESGTPQTPAKPSIHYIVDGSNVAMEARTFKEGGRLQQIELLLDRLTTEAGAAVTVIVDANLRHHIDRKDDLEVMIKERRVLQAPARTDADEFILLTAESHRSRGEDVVVVSNDRYLDYINKFKPRFDWVKSSHKKFMFVFSHDGGEVLEAMISLN
jgi:hypothetical protein